MTMQQVHQLGTQGPISERDGCACDKCVAACKTIPGMLAPGDVEAILSHLGIVDADAIEQFITSHFVGSDGALVSRRGRLFRIPTITPAQQPDGRCVFLTADDRCEVHAVSPYGCREFNVCSPRSADDDRRVAFALEMMLGSPTYLALCEVLIAVGLVARPLFDRKEALASQLQQIEAKG